MKNRKVDEQISLQEKIDAHMTTDRQVGREKNRKQNIEADKQKEENKKKNDRRI